MANRSVLHAQPEVAHCQQGQPTVPQDHHTLTTTVSEQHNMEGDCF
jgi:hypothetical protein